VGELMFLMGDRVKLDKRGFRLDGLGFEVIGWESYGGARNHRKGGGWGGHVSGRVKGGRTSAFVTEGEYDCWYGRVREETSGGDQNRWADRVGLGRSVLGVEWGGSSGGGRVTRKVKRFQGRLEGGRVDLP